MNFQFSGSIPNVHWQNNGNTMSSQPVTEFTILNGRVTLTRATNDTRNDVNVTIVANGRRNEAPPRHCSCTQPIREVRWRNRRRQDLRTLLSTVRDLKDHVNDSNEELSVSRKKLEDLRDEMNKLKKEVYQKTYNVRKASNELAKAVRDLKNTDLYRLNNDETAILRFNLNLATGDLLEAKNNIEAAEKDLDNEVPFIPPDSKDELDIETVMTCVNSSDRVNPSFGVTNVSSLENFIRENPSKCSVCLVNTVNSVLYKCGHMCTCYDCAVKLQQSSDYKKCPVCRSVIVDIIKIFLS